MNIQEIKEMPESMDYYVDSLLANGISSNDPFRYSQGQIKHIRDTLAESAKNSDGVKKMKLDKLVVALNSVYQSMMISDQEFIYIKGKLN